MLADGLDNVRAEPATCVSIWALPLFVMAMPWPMAVAAPGATLALKLKLASVVTATRVVHVIVGALPRTALTAPAAWSVAATRTLYVPAAAWNGISRLPVKVAATPRLQELKARAAGATDSTSPE